MNTYKTRGVCSRAIEFDVNEAGTLTHLKFVGGCVGNVQGIAKLAVGKNIQDIISLLEGIQCRNNTSCPDQLAIALKQYQDKK